MKEDEDDAMSVTMLPSHRPSAAHAIMQSSGGSSSGLSATVSPAVPGSEHGSGGNTLPPGPTSQPFLGDLPHRNHPPYPPPHLLHPDIGAEQHANYVDNGGGITVGSTQSPIAGGHGGMPLQEMCPDPHDTSRRSSLFTPTSEFGGAANPPSVYQGWQHGTTAPSASPMYAFTPQQAQAQAQSQHGPFVSQPSVPIPPQGPGYLGHSFESLPRNSYETSHDGLFRPGHVPAPGGVNSQGGGYPLHLSQHDARAVPPHGLKVEQTRGHLR